MEFADDQQSEGTDSELELAIVAAVERLGEPVTVSALRRALPKPFQKPAIVLAAVLERLVAENRLFRLGSGKAPRYSGQDPRAMAETAVTLALREGPLPKARLTQAVRQALTGFGELDALLANLIEQGRIHAHPKLSKTGLPTRRVEAYALEPAAAPAASLFLGATTTVLGKAVEKAQRYGVSKRALHEELGRLLGVDAEVSESNAGSVDPAADCDRTLSALRELSRQEPVGTLFAVRRLRAALDLDKQRFDEAVLTLAQRGAVILHHHDLPQSLAEGERLGLVRDAQGTHYVGIALGRNG
jgi:hypothetical protein